MQNIFKSIYQRSYWGGAGDGSGGGSEPSNTTHTRERLTSFIQEHELYSIIDAPCGACKWTSVWLHELADRKVKLNYYGIDICDIAIQRASNNLEPLRKYHEINLVCDEVGTFDKYPKHSDLVICRDALQHLSMRVIYSILEKFASIDARWYIIGSYPLSNKANINITNGDYFDIDLQKAPFNMRPDVIIDEMHGDKNLYVFSNASFKAQIVELQKNGNNFQ
jgi:hypothetical protein